MYISIFVFPSEKLSSFMNGLYCLEFENLSKSEDLNFITIVENENTSSTEPVKFYVNRMPPD